MGVDGGDTSEVADGAAPDSTAVDVLAEVRDAADAGGDSDLDATDTRPPTDLSPPFPDVDAGACVEGAPCAAVISGPCQVGRCNALGQCVTVPAVGCCTSDSDCDDFTAPSACEVLRCTNTMCTPDPRPGCCVSSDGCDDGLACTVDLCSGAGGRCAHCASGCDCPGPFEVYSNDFSASDPQAAGFFIEDLDPTDGVSWRPTIRRFISPPASMRLGDTICPTYYSGALNADCQPVDPAGADAGVVEATLYSPPISLPLTPGGHAGLVWVWSDVEPLGTGGPGERDVLRVSVDPGLGVAWPASSSLAVGKSTGGAWRLLAFDLAPYGGATVRLRFAFDTLDASANHHEGVYLDDLSVVSRCQGGCCATDADCAGIAGDAGADGCRSPRCIDLDDGAGKVCALLPDDPALPCTACDSPGSPGSPGSNVACDDQNPCTADSCDNGGVCRHDAFCCFEQLVLSAGFEDGLAGWFVTDDQPTDTVGWRSTHDLAVVGGSSAWFGDPGTGNYAGDARVSGSLSSATVVMPKVGASGAEAQVSFWLRLGTEWDGQLYDNPAGLDRLTLSVIASGSAAEVWSSDEVGGSTGGLWVPVSVPLESYAGRAVQLRFVFDSVDGTANEHEGAYIDGLELGARCGTP
ncbi:MAG: hypothetical protein R3F39_01610 [Myxococcota bacterium]